jgi:uncharacterized membrane protein YgcG
MRVKSLGALLFVWALLSSSDTLHAQESVGLSDENGGGSQPASFVPIERGASGSAILRAFPLTEPIEIDGRLDEGFYRTVPPITGFIQTLPDEGAPATERTDVWITFDDVNVYVLAQCWDSAPESEWIANEMRRDGNQLRENDTFSVTFDTFHDRRNGVQFYTNPLGAQADIAVTNERSATRDWNPIWTVRTGRFDGGWTVEMAIPFKSLRYREGFDTWGVQLRRAIRRKNEWSHITPIPKSVAGTGSLGVMRISLSATLEGLEAPAPSRHLEVKPYAISGLQSDRDEDERLSNDLYGDIGLDVKYGITRSLTADFTVNTDFAQVEVDEQQVNLTRFSLRFPEKREFFLEGSGIFRFAGGRGVGGGGGGGGSSGGGGGGSSFGGGGEAPDLFFSRRIGLEGGEPVPIVGGGRVTGKVGAFDIGALSVQTDADAALDVPSTNFSVLRLRRDVFLRSSIGALFARRSHSTVTDGSNETYGLDATFAFSNETSLLGYYAETRTSGTDGGERSYQARLSHNGDLWGFSVEHLLVDENFNPEVGFLRRLDGFRESQLRAQYSPRPASIEAIRQLTFQTSLDYLADERSNRREERDLNASFRIEFENSDLFMLWFSDTYELLKDPFEIATDVTVPAGGYDYQNVLALYDFGSQRKISGRVSVRRGSFYDGHRTTVSLSQGRIEVLPQLSLEPSVSANWVSLPGGKFNANVISTRVNYSFTPQTYLSGLVQYSSSQDLISTNLRFRWEFAPGSELFVVYTDERNTDVFNRFPELLNRGLVVKVNRLLRP